MRSKNITNQQFTVFILLLIVVGTGIRFYNLTLKMIWADEVASIVHGLGNSFASILSNQIITLTDLMKPLEVDETHGLIEVVKHGIFEDFVPPLFFVLLHLWILLFNSPNQWVDIFTVRSISACFGILSIPSVYFLTKSLFPETLFSPNRSIWLLATLLITLSPYSIALAQEVRNYSIAILLVTLSIHIFFRITQQIAQSNSLSMLQVFKLLILNLLGVASHYFFVLVIITEILTLIIIRYQFKLKSAFAQVSAMTLLNLIPVFAWMPVYFLNSSRDDLTTWAQIDITKPDVIANLFLQLLVASITMIMLLPVESPNTLIVVVSALLMLSVMLITVWTFIKNINYHENKNHDFPLQFMKTYLLVSMFLLMAVSYGFKKDFLSSPRYHFIYFPVVIVLAGYLINNTFFSNSPHFNWQKIDIKKKLTLYLCGFILITSSFCVVNNLSFLKPFHVDLMAKIINDNSVPNTIIVTTNKNLFDTSHTMALGWQLANQQNRHVIPRFFLDQSTLANASHAVVRNTLIQNALRSSTSSALWLINYDHNISLDNCILKKTDTSMHKSHYKYYSCH